MSQDSATRSLIDEGKTHYKAKHYKQALEKYTRAMRRCPCFKAKSRERCTCKKYEQVAEENGSLLSEVMSPCKCVVSKEFAKCDDSLHLHALDSRAAVFEKMEEFERARKDAEWILELAPAKPTGYLRLANVARHQKNNKFAWQVLGAGIEACSQDPSTTPADVKELSALRTHLHKRFGRQDPLQLPLEVLYMIFSLLDLPSKIQCLAVSKAWQASFSAPEFLPCWRNLHFTWHVKQKRGPNLAALNKLLRCSGFDVRELVIANASEFGLNSHKFRGLLKGSRNLRRLEIQGQSEALDIGNKLDLASLKQLTVDLPNFPPRLIACVSNTLETLHLRDYRVLTGRRYMWPELYGISSLPKLKHLKIETTSECMGFVPSAELTPNLEQLACIRVDVFLKKSDQDALRQLTKLKAISIRGPQRYRHIQAAMDSTARLIFANQGEGLQYLEIDLNGREHDALRLLAPPWLVDLHSQDELSPGSAPLRKLKSLRTFHLEQATLDPIHAEKFLRVPVENGCLATFDINFPRIPLAEIEGMTSKRHIEDYSWLRGAESIRSMGVFEFYFAPYPRNDIDEPLPVFLASFPNLRILEVQSSHYEAPEICKLVLAILKVTQLERVYVPGAKGIGMDMLREATQSRGVQLVVGRRKKEWPVPLVEDD